MAGIDFQQREPPASGLTWKKLAGLPMAVNLAMRVALVAIALASDPACPCAIRVAEAVSVLEASAVAMIGNACWPARPAY